MWNYPFVVYDDDDYVYANPVVCAGLTADGVRWAFTSTAHAYNWHPLTWLSHMVDVELFGLDPGAHHLVNVGFHAINAVLLFLALRSLSGAFWPPALVAALFALHPLRVESVAWIAERKDVLAGTFWMATLLAYAHYVRAPSLRRYVVVVACVALGLLAKPTVVSLPFVLLLLDAWPLGRWPSLSPSLAPTHPGTSWKTVRETSGYRLVLEKLPLFGLSAAGALVTLAAQRAGGAMNAIVALDERLMNALLAYAIYLRQALWPVGLAVFYPHPALVAPESFPRFMALMSGLLFLGASLLAVGMRRRCPWLLVGWGWFVVTLIPMIGVLQVGAQAHADRYSYLALIGINIALVWTAADWWQRMPRARSALCLTSSLALLALSLATWRTLGWWKSSIALFERALAVTGENHVAHNNLGLALAEAGRADEALQHFEDAARILPGFFEAQLNLGKARYKNADLKNAKVAFERAVQARPEHAEARFALAVVLHRLWLLDEADLQLRQALALDAAYGEDPDYRAERESLDRHLEEH